MSYTKVELENDGWCLFDAVLKVGKELEKSDTPRTRALAKRLLSNFNTYEQREMDRMLKDFQCF